MSVSTYWLEYQRQWREKRVSQGLCSRCGLNPASKTRRKGSRCEECRAKDRERNERTKRADHIESPRWRELDALQARCRCGLLIDKDHETCDLPEHADGISRRGPGRTYPGTP